MHIEKIARAAILCLMANVAQAATVGELDSFVEEVMQRWQIPGAAVAVVRDDEVILMKGYGLRQIGRPERVDENTTFGIGSVTKSFTATAAAMLVDDGKLAWDAPVIDYLPSLHLSDPWITAHANVRDLAAHRLGIDGYLAYIVIGGDLDQTLRRARYVQPQVPFRTFQYSNTGYGLLGKTVENVSGGSWDDFITNRVLRPLGMRHSYSSEYAFVERANLARCWLCVPEEGTPVGVDALEDRHDNVAVPHGLVEAKLTGRGAAFELKVLPWREDRSVVSTGMIHSSARDMAQYMMFHLSNGELHGKRLMSEAQLHELHSSQVLLSAGFGSQVSQGGSSFSSYGMGWMIGNYRGMPVVRHAGGRVGFAADVWLFPEQKLGIVTLVNLDFQAGAMPELIALRFADHYLNLPLSKEVERSASQRPPNWRPVGARQPECASTAPGSSAPATALAGRYRSDLLGEIQVRSEAGRLAVVFEPQSVADLIPAAHEKFTACFRGYQQSPMPVRFTYDSSDAVTGLVLGEGEPGPANPAAPVFFKRLMSDSL